MNLSDDCPLIVYDSENDENKDDVVRTIIFDIEFDEFKSVLVDCDDLFSFTKFKEVEYDFTLITDEGLVNFKSYPHDGNVSRDFDDYFGGDLPPQDKTGITIGPNTDKVESTALINKVLNIL